MILIKYKLIVERILFCKALVYSRYNINELLQKLAYNYFVYN